MYQILTHTYIFIFGQSVIITSLQILNKVLYLVHSSCSKQLLGRSFVLIVIRHLCSEKFKFKDLLDCLFEWQSNIFSKLQFIQ